MPQHRITLRLTPMVRWMMSFGHEVEEFPKAFNFDLLPQLSERFKVAEERVSTQSQALLKIDLLLLIALALPNLEGIEVFGTPLAKFSFFGGGVAFGFGDQLLLSRGQLHHGTLL